MSRHRLCRRQPADRPDGGLRRLEVEGLGTVGLPLSSIRAIARSVRTSPSTVGDYIRRAKTAGLSWPLPEALDGPALEARLFPVAPVEPGVDRAIPDWARVHTERRRKGVTLALRWQEYKAEHPEGLQYSQFRERYRVWRQRLDVVRLALPCDAEQ